MSGWNVVTGSTGFIGGEWTLRALKRGEKVVALTRPGRENAAKENIALLAKYHNVNPPDFRRLIVAPWVPGSENSIYQQLRQSGVNSIDCIIHAAADMAYDLNKLPRSLKSNLTMALKLYESSSIMAPEAKRFIYISTAYTCGIEPNKPISEELHLTPKLINSYQTSKWATEMALSESARLNKLGLSILRPSIVVGETNNGVYTGKCFGFYMFLRAFALAKKVGAKNLRVNIDPGAEINLLPLNYLLDIIDLLKTEAPSLVVQAALDKGVKVKHMMKVIGEIYELNIKEGNPKTFYDKFFSRQVASNMKFANITFKFDNSSVKMLQPNLNWNEISSIDFRKIVQFSKHIYCHKNHLEKSDLDILLRVIPSPLKKLFVQQ